MTPFQSVTEAGGERFQQYQLRTSLVMGAFSLLLAMLIAWWIARTLLEPVKKVAARVHGRCLPRVAHPAVGVAR